MTSPLNPENATSPAQPGELRPVRLAYVVSHPIQYQAALLRLIANEPDIDLTVFFGSDFSVRSYPDRGFGVELKWDVPLLEGYRHHFLSNLRDQHTGEAFSAISYGFTRHFTDRHGAPAFDALWVHGYTSANSLHAMMVARAHGIPVLLRAESWLGDRERSRSKLALKSGFFLLLRHLVSATLPIGSFNAEYWRHHLGADIPQFLMPYAVNNEYFLRASRAARPARAELANELDLEPGRPVILYASKLQKRKHCSDLISAYARLRTAPGQDPEPYLVIVGAGEEHSALLRQVGEAGLGRTVRFCGFRNQLELPRFFDLATVFVLPSRHEPWGLIVNEAMAAGRPVIVTDECGCHPDLVTDGAEGFVYPARNIDALEACLRKVLATPDTAERMGQNALARISKWSYDQDIAGLRAALAHVTRKQMYTGGPRT